MAKKVAVPDEDTIEQNGGLKKKKKRNCCCTCCLVAVIVMLVLFLGAFIAGWILGDKYTKKLFGLSMGDTLGVLSDLYWTDDKDVVIRPYTSKDLNSFYSEIKKNILLKDSAEIDFQSALDAAVDKYLNSDSTAPQLNANGDGTDGAENKSESDIMDIFTDMIVNVLNRENIDIERLNKYDADDPATDEYIFNLNDRQLAAFVNSVLKSVLSKAVKLDSLKDVSDMIKLDKVVALKQIRFTAKSAKVDGKAEIKASSAEITVWIGLQSAANQAIKKYLYDAKQGWASGIVGWLGDVILPENLYLTVSVPLYGEDNYASVQINDMNTDERKRANKLINGIIKLINGDDSKTLDDVIDDFVGKIRPTLEKATENMDFTDAGKGTIKMDLLETVAQLASDNLAEGENLTKADFLYVLQALLSDKTEQLNSLQPFRYDNWYMVDGVPTYMATGGNADSKIDYEQKFIEQIEEKYAIDFGESKNLTEVLEMLGISLDGSDNTGIGSTDLLDKVNGNRFNALLDEDISNLKLNVTDRMLGAAFSGQMDKLLVGNADLQKLGMTLDALTFVKKTNPEKADHLYALLAVEVDVSGLIGAETGGQNSMVNKLVKGLMPDSILLTVTVDITRDRSITKDKAEFKINSSKNTDRVLDVIERLVPEIKLNDVSDKISTQLNDMLDQMDSKINIVLAATTYEYNTDIDKWLGDSGAIVLPDIFSVVADMVLVDEGGNKVVTSEQLQHVIRDLNNPATITATQPSGYGDFIGQVFDKYYLTKPEQLPEPQPPVTDFTGLIEYLKDFKTDKLRVYGRDGVAHDVRAMSALHPTMSAAELLLLLKDNMGDKDAIQSYNIVKVDIDDNMLAVTLSIRLSDLLTDAQQVQKLISATELYATATFHTDRITGDGTEDSPKGYGVELSINVKKQGENDVMDSDTYGAMLNIVKFFAKDFDIENQVKEFGVILYEQMQSLNASMGGSAENSLFTFTSNGLELTDFYTFLALKMKPELLDKHSNEDIRSTVQGLYTYDETAQNDSNFKVSDITFNPPSQETDPHTLNGSTAWTDDEAKTLYGNTHLDADFNGFLKRGVESISDSNDITVEQTMVLAKGDDREKVQTVRDWLNNGLGLTSDDVDYVSANNDYIAITFSMTMGSFVGGDGQGSQDASSMFPKKIYATVVYLYNAAAGDGEDKFSIVGDDRDGHLDGEAPLLVFNDMSPIEYDIMVQMMGVSPDSTDESKVNIVSIVMRGKEVLNGMTHIEYSIGGSTWSLDTTITFSATSDTANPPEDGMGKIYISRPVPSYGG
ncbi:MAG: hypothetical protein K2M89_00375 [Clostridiales bacterium]|nr:hypothetical protein [Clostridiales bacterium]